METCVISVHYWSHAYVWSCFFRAAWSQNWSPKLFCPPLFLPPHFFPHFFILYLSIMRAGEHILCDKTTTWNQILCVTSLTERVPEILGLGLVWFLLWNLLRTGRFGPSPRWRVFGFELLSNEGAKVLLSVSSFRVEVRRLSVLDLLNAVQFVTGQELWSKDR